jgi:hypothetical protein
MVDRGGAICPQLELLADAVFRPCRAHNKVTRRACGRGRRGARRGDDNAVVGALRRMLGVGDDAALATPAIAWCRENRPLWEKT